jgi:hypothetical protein
MAILQTEINMGFRAPTYLPNAPGGASRGAGSPRVPPPSRHAEGVVLIGVAQEKVNGFRVYQKNRRTRQQRHDGKPPMFSFYRGSIDVNQYYFYILDREFGLWSSSASPA